MATSHTRLFRKSNRLLRPGQFWAIPLSDGRFGAGRVMTVPAFGAKDRVGVVVGLMDWVGDHEPTADDLAARNVLVQASSRFDSISRNGGHVIGLRSLDLDGIIPLDPTDLPVGSVRAVWGATTIVKHAERLAASHSEHAVEGVSAVDPP